MWVLESSNAGLELADCLSLHDPLLGLRFGLDAGLLLCGLGHDGSGWMGVAVFFVSVDHGVVSDKEERSGEEC